MVDPKLKSRSVISPRLAICTKLVHDSFLCLWGLVWVSCLPPSAWTAPLGFGQPPSVALGGGLAGLPGWRTSQALPRAQTSQIPVCPSRLLLLLLEQSLGPITESLGHTVLLGV